MLFYESGHNTYTASNIKPGVINAMVHGKKDYDKDPVARQQSILEQVRDRL